MTRTGQRHFHSAFGAFTLLELMLVLLIIAVALTFAAPKLRAWGRGRELRDAAEQFISLTRYARAQAASTGNVHRITIDSQSSTYQLTRQDGQTFIPEGTDFGDVQKLPSGYHI